MAFGTNLTIVNNLQTQKPADMVRYTTRYLISSDTVTTVQEIVPAQAGETIIVHKIMLATNAVAGSVNFLSNNVVFLNLALTASDLREFNFFPFSLKGTVSQNLQFQKLASTQTVSIWITYDQRVYT